ncbi:MULTISPECIES: L,D-transpeptidase family protein [Rhodomicrobium]|uniref:L,D-transpeptidase family protein n=1 Tax=Rhodomicrobium TaxID=1068 RepID=UPI000B4BA16A|nr:MULTISPECIES: L,D-transpeptidase family protein [Rhodomicrobium]
MPLIVVRGLSRAGTQGKLHLGAVHVPCALGRGGRGAKSGEGDGVTPRGRWSIRHVFYRPDRVARPNTALPVSPLTPDMGWCDAPGDANYNRLVRLPYPASHERMWREDRLYDLVVVLGFNDSPRAQGRGSAIFLHLAHDDYRPTEGCIAVSREAMVRVLEMVRPGDGVLVV